MSNGVAGFVLAACIAIFIAFVSYLGSTLPVPDNWVAGQAMPLEK